MIRQATVDDLFALTSLGCLLWPHHTATELETDFSETINKADAAFFLAFSGSEPLGFAQCQLRHDYVEGTETTPVGYLEGIFVKEAARNQGLAAELLAACENWAKTWGCREFASDCELSNDASLRFHLALGFEEANRIICFTKKL